MEEVDRGPYDCNEEVTCSTDHGCVILNGAYEDSEGKLHKVIEVARNAITGEFLVIYRSKDSNMVHARPLKTDDKQGWFDLVKWPAGTRPSHGRRFAQTTWFHYNHGHRREGN